MTREDRGCFGTSYLESDRRVHGLCRHVGEATVTLARNNLFIKTSSPSRFSNGYEWE